MNDEDRLAAAVSARHKLLTGTAAVEVDTGVYKTRFTPANREALEAYIAELQDKISGRRRSGAIGFVL
jgi:hypothetical protein